MRIALLAVVAVVIGCGGQHQAEPEASFQMTAAGASCANASESFYFESSVQTPFQSCIWTCAHYSGAIYDITTGQTLPEKTGRIAMLFRQRADGVWEPAYIEGTVCGD